MSTKETVRAFYREKNPYYYRLLGELLCFMIPEGKRLLDLGCGMGDFLNFLKPSYGVGVDNDPDALDIAKRKFPHLTWIEQDIERLELDDDLFDYILLINTIGFLHDIQAALNAAGKYSGNDSRLIIIHYNYLWEPILKFAEQLGLKNREPYLNWLSMGDIENLLYTEGFEVIKKKQCILFPKHIPFLSVFLNRVAVNLPFLWRLGLVEVLVARPMPEEGRMQTPTCSVIVPARNEKGTIEKAVRRIPVMGSHTEIIFVEGHSEDGTRAEIERVASVYHDKDIKMVVQKGDGKADAVREGFAQASGEILMILDADLTVCPEDLPKFYECIASGKGELAIGCRLVYQLEEESMRFLNLIGNKFFSMIFSYLLGQRIKDTLCGTKALKSTHYRLISATRDYFGNFDPFGDFDLIFGAAKANLRIVEIPVRYQARRYGATQIKRFSHGFLLFKMVCVAMKKLKFV